MWMYWQKYLQWYYSDDAVWWKAAYSLTLKVLILCPVVLEKKIFKISSMYYYYFLCYYMYLPLKKRHGPSFEQTWILFSQESFVSSLVETGQVVQ